MRTLDLCLQRDLSLRWLDIVISNICLQFLNHFSSVHLISPDFDTGTFALFQVPRGTRSCQVSVLRFAQHVQDHNGGSPLCPYAVFVLPTSYLYHNTLIG